MAVIKELYGDFKFIISFRNRVMKERKELDKSAPKEGDLAPDFSLNDVSGAKTVTLSDFRGKKPVALVFGSFT